ncbi:uncharacterized protein F4812DRAFT_447756 [Daldinia caldariorum]|uniref:uncharacterized protein n=1 Tax=Daldinia caldariorum TaxID=326644 RepID=UPI002007AB3A|nr:uncharacterized protein F4812DRAFT_447756 [Daldinia caldariorum]KAI1463133.1 hypothetical protein F4812DRAFT_447756 [Daldinia caldariorum]
MADSRTLRIVTAATFLPAFPLCLAHGIVSGSPTPAVGLVPLAFSAGAGIFINSRQSRSKQPSSEPEPDLERGDVGESALEQEYERGPETDDTPQSREASDAPTPAPASRSTPTHPFLTFAVDLILAAALMVVLVFIWIDSSSGSTNSAESAMLAAYATIPLLINFLIHLFLAVREFSRGLAIPGLTQYLAWQAVPPDCPNCGHQLRPDAPPRMPWLDEASLPRPNLNTKIRSVKWKLPAIPKVKAPQWRTPTWFRNRGARGYAPLFVSTDPHDDDDRDDRDVEEETAAPVAPYRDDPEAGEPSARFEEPEMPQPEVIEIVGKKSKKLSRNSSSSHST